MSRGWRWLIALLLVAALLAAFYSKVDWATVLHGWRRLPWWGWVLAAAGWLSTYLIRAWRLRAEWAHVHRAPFGRCLRMMLAHNAAVLLTPMRLGEAGYVWLVQREWGGGWDAAVRSLIWLRWQDLTVLGSLGVALFAPLPVAWRAAAAATTALLGVFALPRWSAAAHANAAAQPLARRWLGTLAQRGPDAQGWLASAANWLVRLAVVGSVLCVLAGVPLGAGLQAALGTELSSLLPVQGPAGLGTYEAGAWFGAHLAGADASAVVGAAILAHVFCVSLSLAAAAVAHVWPALGQFLMRFSNRPPQRGGPAP